MEVKEKSKKRELIKTIAIVFLTVLLLLTFFSQTIMNASLPEVATQVVSGGTINAKIRGTGTASANESYEVILDQTREIRSVCVKVGDTVQQGDLLFVLGDVESQELKEAQEALANLNIEYQKKILNFSKEYATEDRDVAKLQEDLEKAIADRDANQVTEAEISYAKGDLASAKNEDSQITQLLEELVKFETENANYLNAKKELDKWEKEAAELESAVKTYETQLEAIKEGDISASDRALDDARRKLENANATWRSNWMAYAKDLQDLISRMKADTEENKDRDWKNIQPLSTIADSSPQRITEQQQIYLDAYLAANGTKSATTPDDGAEAHADLDSIIKDGEAAYTALLSSQEDVDAAQVAYDRAREDRNDISDEPTEQRRDIQRKLDEVQGELTRAQRELNAAQSSIEAMTATYREQKNRYTTAQQTVKTNIELLTEKLDELTKKQETYKAALTTIEEKERALTDALSGKDIDKQLDNLDLQSARLDIQKQQELVEKYRQDTIDTEIKASVSGTVSAINVTAGKDNKPGEAMAVIDVVDRGFTIRIPVTNDQARQVKIGDEAEVTNYYWGGDVKATLEAIANDPSKPGQGKLLVFRVTGEVEAGTSLTLAVGQQSAAFETIVPKSALRSDSNGDFVLVITAKSTPLGNRYTATRADVQILASDDVSAAVSGLSAGDYVITTSSKPLDAGTQVRMVENQ
ncbi:MAG: HlyD family efflux transporter periplasmic adaptor subunit [Oscillospiraceae bacterium]|jgi:multidrug efflux pump subunit AcrA (membrane-fusion protein)|nr:HlyD family efflux transporter periplasmic adaptor subunit [Oscillospiraceae bacterium]